MIIEGGPGTGKSVVAINLLVELTAREKVAKYVTKNAAPREVYESKLKGDFTKSHISSLFTSSGSFVDCELNTFDALVVDEAHRLNEKSGMFKNKGINQIKELIQASKLSVFFIDDAQRVTMSDIGEVESIRSWAKASDSNVTELKLESQFRCNGSDGYLAWVDNTLGIRTTANTTLDGISYDFRVCGSATELRNLIRERNLKSNKARMVAGYCWKWESKSHPGEMDIVLPEENFSAQWNFSDAGSPWILQPDSVRADRLYSHVSGPRGRVYWRHLRPGPRYQERPVGGFPEKERVRTLPSRGGKLHRSDPAAADRKATEIFGIPIAR